jgi:UTP--glucose-1-phosphate uridylyltransferase
VAAKAMRNELSRLAEEVSDPNYRKAFEAEMQGFFLLFSRYLQEKARNTPL